MRKINWDEPLTEDDKAWLRDRDMHAEIETHEAKFAPEPKDLTPAFDDDYDSWKIGELRAEAEAREGLDTAGLKNKPDYIAALRTWDAANPE